MYVCIRFGLVATQHIGPCGQYQTSQSTNAYHSIYLRSFARNRFYFQSRTRSKRSERILPARSSLKLSLEEEEGIRQFRRHLHRNRIKLYNGISKHLLTLSCHSLGLRPAINNSLVFVIVDPALLREKIRVRGIIIAINTRASNRPVAELQRASS